MTQFNLKVREESKITNWRTLKILGFGILIGSLIGTSVMAEGPASSSIPNSKLLKSSSQKFSGEWKIFLGGSHFEEGLDDLTWAHLTFKSKLNYKLYSQLQILTQLKVQAESSQVQSRFSDVNRRNLSFQEFVVDYQPFDFLNVQGGAISQKYINNSLLLEKGRAFPGFKEELAFKKGKKLGIYISAQQSIPTSSTFNTNLSEKEKTPSYFMETIKLETKPLKKMKLTGTLGHYLFKDLPSIVSEKSGLYGNTVDTSDGTRAPGVKFAEEFNGGFAGLEMDLKLRGFDFKVGSQFMKNFRAEEKSNLGSRSYLEAGIGNKNFKVSPGLEYFFAESDVTPAYYNDASLGHTNRQGMKYKMNLVFEDLGFLVSAAYTDSRLINENLSQDDLRGIELQVETLYVDF